MPAMTFDPQDRTLDAVTWKPSAELCGLALRRCAWINSDALDELEGEEWLRAVIVGAYYQGVADIVKYNSRKPQAKPEALDDQA